MTLWPLRVLSNYVSLSTHNCPERFSLNRVRGYAYGARGRLQCTPHLHSIINDHYIYFFYHVKCRYGLGAKGGGLVISISAYDIKWGYVSATDRHTGRETCLCVL